MSSRNEAHIQTSLQLMQARKQALQRINKIQMRSHGKVLQKDFFTWFGNDYEDLLQTLSSFPKPLHWIAKKQEVQFVLSEKHELLSSFDSVIIYDDTKFILPSKFAKKTTTHIALSTLEDALIMAVTLPKNKGVLLLSGHVSDEKQSLDLIENFIERYKS